MAGANVATVAVRTAPAKNTSLNEDNGVSRLTKVIGAGGTDDSASHNDNWLRGCTHETTPQAHGSFSSIIRVVSAVMLACPLTWGTISP